MAAAVLNISIPNQTDPYLLIKDIVASIIMLFSNTLQRGFPYRRRLQRELSSKKVRSIPGIVALRRFCNFEDMKCHSH